MEGHPNFDYQVEELERLYTIMETCEADLESSLKSDYILKINETVTLKKDELTGSSKTSALWVNYQYMVRIGRLLVATNRMRS